LSGSNDLQAQLSALDEATEFAETELIKVWRVLSETDYGHFYEFMNRDEGYTLSQHQRLIADLLMRAEAGELMRGMVSMPPGHCKSTHCSHHFPAWYLGRNPRRRFLQAGHSQDFVENEMGAKVRDIINSEDYGHIFPDIHIRTDMKAKAYWGLSNRKGKYVGKGVGQGISGFRGDFGSVDDPLQNPTGRREPDHPRQGVQVVYRRLSVASSCRGLRSSSSPLAGTRTTFAVGLRKNS
jgi:hypothetical protein